MSHWGSDDKELDASDEVEDDDLLFLPEDEDEEDEDEGDCCDYMNRFQ